MHLRRSGRAQGAKAPLAIPILVSGDSRKSAFPVAGEKRTSVTKGTTERESARRIRAGPLEIMSGRALAASAASSESFLAAASPARSRETSSRLSITPTASATDASPRRPSAAVISSGTAAVESGSGGPM